MCEKSAQAVASELKTREGTASAERTKKELAQADSEADKKVLDELIEKAKDGQ